MRRNRLGRRPGESVWIMRSRWHITALEIIRYVRAQAARRRVEIRRAVAHVPVRIVVRVVGRHAVVTSLRAQEQVRS